MKQHYENGDFINSSRTFENDSPEAVIPCHDRSQQGGQQMKHISIDIDTKDFNNAPVVRLDGKRLCVNYVEYIHDENTHIISAFQHVNKARLKIIYFDDNDKVQTLTVESPYEMKD